MELSSEVRRAVRQYKPVKTDGLILYPVTVAEYEDFLEARPAIEFMQQALDANYISLPLLSALYKLDYTNLENGKAASGLFVRSLLALALSLRLGEGKEPKERVREFTIVCDSSNPSKLKALQFVLCGEEKQITAVQYQRLRPIIAAQNGVEIPSDDVNPELAEAERDIANANAPKLDIRLEDLIAGVSALSGAEEEEIETWPILKLQNRQNAYRRAMDYTICAIAESQGTKWKGGNPHPSPWFERIREESASLTPLESFAGGEGLKAVERAGINTAEV